MDLTNNNVMFFLDKPSYRLLKMAIKKQLREVLKLMGNSPNLTRHRICSHPGFSIHLSIIQRPPIIHAIASWRISAETHPPLEDQNAVPEQK